MLSTEEKLLRLAQERFSKKYCPLINNHCRSSCICYDAGEIIKVLTDTEPIIIEPKCTNAMFTGLSEEE